MPSLDSTPPDTSPLRRSPTTTHWLALIGAAVAFAASMALVLQHLTGRNLPGCGFGGGCQKLTEGAYGSIAGWPVSFFGTAYFLAVFVGLAWGGRTMPGLWKWLIRAGAAASVAFLAIMLWKQLLCPYCLAVHAGNGLLWLSLEFTELAPTERGWLALCGVGATFCSSMIALGGVEYIRVNASRWEAEAELQDSTEQIVAQVGLSNASRRDGPFTGRYRQGPEQASLRVVAWIDYGCAFCRTIEGAMEEIVAEHAAVSFSIKQFPLCSDCNEFANGRIHPKACVAAEAVEAAGVLAGQNGFWRMHRWVLEQEGDFSETELRAALPELDIDNATAFFEAMDGDEVAARIQADIAEAGELGIDSTPFIFVNGVELNGVVSAESLRQAFETLLAKRLEPQTAAVDAPMAGIDRIFQMWSGVPQLKMPAADKNWSLGEEKAPIRVDFVADHENPRSAMASRMLREAIERHAPSTRLVFWHFPLSKNHNRNLRPLEEDLYARSHEMALAAEAAGALGGKEAFWKMHEWLLQNQSDFSREKLASAGEDLGLKADDLQAAMDKYAVRRRMDDQMETIALLGVRWAPQILVDGRVVKGWHTNPEAIDKILESLK